MKYYIDYKKNTSEILGFLTDLNKTQAMGILQEVSKEVFDTQMNKTNNNKIIIDGENISFDKVDWRTPEEIEETRIIAINNKVEEIIIKPYPIYKQLNIRGQLLPYSIDDLEIMNMFIDTTRYIGKDAKSNGTKVEDINWAGLDEYSTSDEITESDLLSIRKLVKAI